MHFALSAKAMLVSFAHFYGFAKNGALTGCGQRHCAPSRQQVAWNETAEFLIPLSHLLSLLSLRTGKVSAACSRCRTYSHWAENGLVRIGLGAAMPVAPKGQGGLTPWRTSYKVARSIHGIIVVCL